MNPASPWRVVILVALSIAVLTGILVVTGPLRVRNGQPLQVDFGFAGPIKPGAAIRISGVVVGVIDEVEFLGGQNAAAGSEVMVRLHADIEDKAWPILTTSSRFFVTTLGVLGEHYLDIMPQPGGNPLKPGAVVRGTDLARADLLLPRAAALLEVMNGVLDEGRQDATQLMRALTELVSLLQSTLSENESGQMVQAGRSLLEEIRSLVSALRVVLGDGSGAKALLQKANHLADRGDALANEFNESDFPGFMASGKETMQRLNGTLAELSDSPLWQAQTQKELVGQVTSTLSHIDRLSIRAERLLARIEKGEGAAGQAFQDETLIQDLKSVLRALRDGPMRPWVQE